MGRKPRIHYPGAIYHVILRGNARQDIFFDDVDRCRFTLLLQEGVERYHHRILAFCLMSNHVHLVVQVSDISLSRIMQNLSFRYTRWINWRRNRVGHLFQGRYKAFIVDADSYLLELVAYLHLNPIRVNVARVPQDYPWSSHRAYLRLETIPWLHPEPILLHFSTDVEQSRRQFSEFVSERAADGHREEFYGKDSCDRRVIGADRFVENVLVKIDDVPVNKPSLDDILSGVTRIYGLKEVELKAAGQKRMPAEARALAAWGVLELSNATLTELSDRVGRDASSLSSAAQRLAARSDSSPELQNRLNTLKGMLEVAALQA